MREVGPYEDFARLGVWLDPLWTWLNDRVLGPAVVAIAFTGLTTYIIERHRGRRDALSKMLEQVREDARLLQTAAIEYWSRDYTPEDEVLAARIIVLEQDFSRTTTFLNDGLAVMKQAVLAERLSDIREAMMGGDFQTRRKVQNPNRIRNLSSKIGSLRLDMTRARLSSLSRFSGD